MRKLLYFQDLETGEYLHLTEGLTPNTHKMREVTKEEYEQHTLLYNEEEE